MQRSQNQDDVINFTMDNRLAISAYNRLFPFDLVVPIGTENVTASKVAAANGLTNPLTKRNSGTQEPIRI